MAGVRTLVVWCPDWPVVAAGFHPRQPVAVVEGQVVMACSAAARRSGVRRGQRRREAQARCPEAIVVSADPSRDARAFEPVVTAVESFVPAVEIIRPGVCAFPTRGPSRYFGGDEALSAKLTSAVEEVLGQAWGAEGVAGSLPVGWGCRVGVADGPFAATLAARRGRVIPPGQSATFLAPFPVASLDRPELADLLYQLGIRTLGAFAALPAGDVLARFGTDGSVAHEWARGLDGRPVVVRQPPPDLSVATWLDPPISRVDAAAFAAKSLADELSAGLVAQGVACSRLRIEAETEHGEELVRLWRHDGRLTPTAIADRVRWQLDGWLTSRAGCGCPVGSTCPRGSACGNKTGGTSGALVRLRLVPNEVHADRGHQLGFWSGGSATDGRAPRALARLQALLGPEAVVTAVAGGGRSPIDRIRLVPWGDPRESARSGTPFRLSHEEGPHGDDGAQSELLSLPIPLPAVNASSNPPWPGAIPPPSPAIVYTSPLSAEVVDAAGAPVVVDDRGVASTAPARVLIAGGSWAEVQEWAGPWMLDERWWDGASCLRHARWQITTAEGAAFLLSFGKGKWSVEASYD